MICYAINNIIEIKEIEIRQAAEKLFRRQCCAGASAEAEKNMIAVAEPVRKMLAERMNTRLIVSFVPAEDFKDNAVCIGDESISCDYFSHISEESVAGIYIYAVTIGDLQGDLQTGKCRNAMDLMYEEMWANSYLNAAVTYMEASILEDMKSGFAFENLFLSKAYGPGYYGMPIEMATAFLRGLGSEKIGVSASKAGIITPGKTCTGLYFVLDKPENETEPACAQCMGNKGGCEFCYVNKE